MTTRWCCRFICTVALAATATSSAGQMLVSSFSGSEVLRFDASTGNFVNVYIPAALVPHGIMIGPDCNLYVASAGNDSVLRFSTTSEPTGIALPSATGTPGTAEFVAPGAGGLEFIGSSDFGPDGNLYVASGNGVLRYDGATGAFIDVFVAQGSGGLLGAALLHFGPDGDLYVPGTASNGVMRFDGTTGLPKPGAFGQPGTAQFATDLSLEQVHNFDFAPNGNLYVADYVGDKIVEFDGTTGALLTVLVAAGGDLFPHGLTFGPDGTFYTASLGEPLIHRFQADGTPFGVFVDGTGFFDGASQVAFPSGCGAPETVPDGTQGTQPLRAARLDASGASVRVDWDVSSCSASRYHLLYGSLPVGSAYAHDGALCETGAGSLDWTSVPSGSLWFVVVGNDGAGMEGSWGVDGDGLDRNGTVPSARCGNAQRSNGGSCSAP